MGIIKAPILRWLWELNVDICKWSEQCLQLCSQRLAEVNTEKLLRRSCVAHHFRGSSPRSWLHCCGPFWHLWKGPAAHLMASGRQRDTENLSSWVDFILIFFTLTPSWLDGAVHIQGSSSLSCCSSLKMPSQTHRNVLWESPSGPSGQLAGKTINHYSI